MAEITFSITILPDESAQDMLNAFCVARGFSNDTGLTQQDFFKQEVIELLKSYYVQKKREILDQQTVETLRDDLNDISVT